MTTQPKPVDAQAQATSRLDNAFNALPPTIRRAYEIARSGECASLDELVQQLKSEQFEGVDMHIASASLRRDLRQISQSARRHEA